MNDWTLRPGTFIWERKGCKILDTTGHKAAEVSASRIDETELEARGRLFASAPDLYAALAELDRFSLVIESAVRHQERGSYQPILDVIKQARTALAKARGEAE